MKSLQIAIKYKLTDKLKLTQLLIIYKQKGLTLTSDPKISIDKRNSYFFRAKAIREDKSHPFSDNPPCVLL